MPAWPSPQLGIVGEVEYLTIRKEQVVASLFTFATFLKFAQFKINGLKPFSSVQYGVLAYN